MADTHDFRRLQRLVLDFSNARDWAKYHDPKNLAMAVAVEAGELMDHFRWIANDQANSVLEDHTSRAGVQEEVADVLILLLEFAHVSGIDLAEAVEMKLQRNADRYPVHLARGNATKHHRLGTNQGGQGRPA
jgi:NTP pyrophosphatase (non-canonical NTP hydrolase)